MADISKCSDKECPIKNKCYRFTAKSGRWQAYGNFKYDKVCGYFWDNKKNK